MPRVYVALDVETTGLDPERDAIIEVGAIRFSESGVMGQFSSLANPGRAVPSKIVHLTGIDPRQLQSAPPAWEVARRLARFVGSDPIVGHSVGFDMAFLGRHQVLANNRKIDTFELSTILLPHMARHSLQHLATALSLGSDSAHRALADAEAAMRLFSALQDAARSLPPSLLEQIVSLGRRSGWEQSAFFEDMLREHLQRPSGTSIGQQLFAKGAMNERPSLLAGIERETLPDIEPRKQPIRLDTAALRTALEPGGKLAASMPAYEHRPEQITMMEAVATALNNGHHLVAEAGTGVGKSLAYLLPAMLYSVMNGERILISTQTINLQEQLYMKDIPQVASALDIAPRVALLKGRNNYLCLIRLHSLANRPALTHEQALALAKIITWLPATTTGDRSELFLNTPAERQVWQQTCADDAWCHGERCPERQRGNCFFIRAREAARKAHLVIINHALLTTDAVNDGHTLPEHDHLVVDEAHQLESACTRAMRVELTLDAFRDVFKNVVFQDRGTLAGPLPALQYSVSRKQNAESRLGQDIASLTETVGSITSLLDPLGVAMDRCAASLLSQSRGADRGFGEQRRITEKERQSAEWRDLVSSWEPVSRLCQRALFLLQEVVRASEAVLADSGTNESLQALSASTRLLQDQADAFDEIIASPKAESVYWLSVQDQTGALVLNRAPTSVAASLAEALFEQKRSVILTSATLATDGRFDYFTEQIGLKKFATVAVGSPFDYRRSALVCVANDIPEPRQPGHQRAIEQAILELARATGGRLMALFTSNSQLRLTTRSLTRSLEQEGILLYSQSEGGSRNALLEGFKSAERAVLLGTRSFWEGVDVPGEALQCLVMVKLPFMVPDDPLVAARGERFGDSFNEYLLPEAILTFRQGFGRLIRTKTDRGAFVLLDSRVRSKNYGQRFIRALPNCTFYDGSISSIPERVLLWLKSSHSG